MNEHYANIQVFILHISAVLFAAVVLFVT